MLLLIPWMWKKESNSEIEGVFRVSHTAAIDIETGKASERTRLILRLTWPALAENLLSTIVSIADTMMVSVLGTAAVSAVGLVTQPRFIMLSAFMALGIGSTAIIARCKGAGKRDEANHVLSQSIVLSVMILIALCTVMYIFAEPLIRFIAGNGISEKSIQDAYDYLVIQIWGFPFLGLTFTMNACLRGAGNTKAAFYSNTAANIVNIFFNYCLIEGRLGFPRLEVAGASLATVIGQAVAFLFACCLLLTKGQYIRLKIRTLLKVDVKMIGRIIKIGIPAAVEQIILRVGMMLFTLIATSLGELQYSSHIIAMNIQSLSFTTGMAFGTAATTITGQCLGRKRADLARQYLKITQRLGLAVSVVIAVLLFFGGGFVAGLYNIPEHRELVVPMVAGVLQIIAVVNPISNARFVYNSALRGAGDSRYTAFTTTAGILVTRPIIAGVLVFALDMGLTGLWIALSSDAIVCYILAKIRWARGRWAYINV